MTQTLTIALTETEMNLLRKQAALDCRRPQEQARHLLRSVLFNGQSAVNVNRRDLQSVESRQITAVSA
jgi:hypothetical protein